jgi:hypothetical protein
LCLLAAAPARSCAATPEPQKADGEGLSPKALAAAWDDLAGGDAAQAFRAIASLAKFPAQSVPFLKARLKPVAPADPRRVAQLLTDLASDQAAVHQKASEELEKLGDLARKPLEKALAAKEPAKVRERIEKVLAKLDKATLSSELLRSWRAIEVLEHIGTPEARQVLQALAKGAPEHRLTEEAQASLERLARRRGKNP